MKISNIFSAIAIIVSIVALVQTNRTQEKKHLFEQEREYARKLEAISQSFLTENENRVSLIPYFHLKLEDEICIKEITGKNMLILPLALINLGRESATNIQLEPMIKGGGLENFFETDLASKNIHFVYDDFDKQYALAKDEVKFSSFCDFHDKAYNVYFKIKFNDLVGRTYEQKFRFQYCYKIMHEFSGNSTTFLPICVENTDKTSRIKV